MKTTQTRTRKGCLFRACSSKGVNDSKASREVGKLYGGVKGSLPVHPVGKASCVDRLTRSGAYLVIGQGVIFCFLQLVPDWKLGQKLSTLSVINQVLAMWGQILLGLLICFLNWLLRIVAWRFRLGTIDNGLISWAGCCRLGVRVQILHVAWLLSVYSVFHKHCKKYWVFKDTRNVLQPRGEIVAWWKRHPTLFVTSWSPVQVWRPGCLSDTLGAHCT